MLPTKRGKLHGGAHLRAFKLIFAAAVLFLASSVVRADGIGDPRVNMGGGPGGSPTCGSNTGTTGSAGLLSVDCIVVAASEGGTGTVTKFAFEVADINTFSAGITCSSKNLIGWSFTSVNVSGGIDTCFATAPTTVSATTLAILKAMHDPFTGKNDGDCDADDFVLGIPVGCDIKITSLTGQDLFKVNAPVGFASNNDSLPSLLPEPGTVSLLMLGLTGLPFLRRKVAR
jgi:hypothetical protein